ncbi:MBL fold metallo-hydrolase [Thermus amyloliquefaciens]|uniref:MBL fold metallo-hydrolase n=1 Tax=Thermus amyloliquefaciens TaxID=1449080 RepID=UPI00056E0C65|nr:MBL fold metallo-hydrolase [Thermus amyloliquefaciens]
MQVIPLWTGFPGRTHRGYLGASSAYAILASKVVLYDTLGFGEREGLYDRLNDLGIPPERVEVVVVSHLHFDHAANVDLFPWAEVILHPREWAHAERVARNPLEDPACLYPLLPLLERLHLKEVATEEEIMPGLRLLHLPGHTPGLLGLEVEGMGVLVSDAVKSRFDLEGPPAPPCWNPKLALESRARIREYPRIFPGHDTPLVRRGESLVPEAMAELGLVFGGKEVKLTV